MVLNVSFQVYLCFISSRFSFVFLVLFLQVLCIFGFEFFLFMCLFILILCTRKSPLATSDYTFDAINIFRYNFCET